MNYTELIKKIEEYAAEYMDNDIPIYIFEIFQTKWYAKILFELCKKEPMRFGELKRVLPSISNVVLSNALKQLEEADLIIRKQFNEIPPHVEYSLTDSGRGMLPVFYEMISWNRKYKSVKASDR